VLDGLEGRGLGTALLVLVVCRSHKRFVKVHAAHVLLGQDASEFLVGVLGDGDEDPVDGGLLELRVHDLQVCDHVIEAESLYHREVRLGRPNQEGRI